MVEWAHQEARGEGEGRSEGKSEGSRDGGGVSGVSRYEGRRGKGRRREGRGRESKRFLITNSLIFAAGLQEVFGGFGRRGVRREGMHRYQINRINRHDLQRDRLREVDRDRI